MGCTSQCWRTILTSGGGACRYVSAMNNHIVNPVITPSTASGTPSGILAASLVGPDYKYSAVWTPINLQLGVPFTLPGCSCDGSSMVCCHARGTTDAYRATCDGGESLPEVSQALCGQYDRQYATGALRMHGECNRHRQWQTCSAWDFQGCHMA